MCRKCHFPPVSGTRCQNSESIPNEKSTPSTAVIPGSNPNCKGGNENPLENPPGFQPCPQRDFKNNPEIQRQIYLMQDNDFFKALRPSSESSGGCPVVTNSYGLPNIASLYFGGSIASIRNTVPFVPKESKCGSSGCLNLAEVILQVNNLNIRQADIYSIDNYNRKVIILHYICISARPFKAWK